MRVQTRIAGIPCEVELEITPGDPGRIIGPAEVCYPPESPEVEILAVYDRKGYEARWLMHKMTDDDIERIMVECERSSD